MTSAYKAHRTRAQQANSVAYRLWRQPGLPSAACSRPHAAHLVPWASARPVVRPPGTTASIHATSSTTTERPTALFMKLQPTQHRMRTAVNEESWLFERWLRVRASPPGSRRVALRYLQDRVSSKQASRRGLITAAAWSATNGASACASTSPGRELRAEELRRTALCWRSIWVEHLQTNPYSPASIGPDPSFAVNMLAAAHRKSCSTLTCQQSYKSAVECSQNLRQQEVLAAKRFPYECQCSPACRTCGSRKCLAAKRFPYRCQCSPACKTCGNRSAAGCFSHTET